jgi:hypothetical protein
MSTITTSELERKIYELEEVRVIIRAGKNDQVQDYDYSRKAATNTSISEWLNTRVRPLLPNGVEVDVIDGSGSNPHGRTNIENVRNSYVK